MLSLGLLSICPHQFLLFIFLIDRLYRLYTVWHLQCSYDTTYPALTIQRQIHVFTLVEKCFFC